MRRILVLSMSVGLLTSAGVAASAAQPSAEIHGGGGRITFSGRVGKLRLDRSRRSDIVRFAGRADAVGPGVSNPHSAHVLGYDCHGSGFPVTPHRLCSVSFYVNSHTHHLSDVTAGLTSYIGPHGVRVGMKTREAERRLNRKAFEGCLGPGITLPAKQFHSRAFLTILFEGGRIVRHRRHNGTVVSQLHGGHVGNLLSQARNHGELQC
jgi:hypothetical protein